MSTATKFSENIGTSFTKLQKLMGKNIIIFPSKNSVLKIYY